MTGSDIFWPICGCAVLFASYPRGGLVGGIFRRSPPAIRKVPSSEMREPSPGSNADPPDNDPPTRDPTAAIAGITGVRFASRIADVFAIPFVLVSRARVLRIQWLIYVLGEKGAA